MRSVTNYGASTLTQSAPKQSIRRRLTRGLRRHRRSLAAVSTALGVLFTIAALRPAPPLPPPPPDPRLPPPGQVALAVELTNASAAGLLQAGDRVDVVSVGDSDQTATILARDAMVLAPTLNAGFVGSASSSVLLAMTESAALEVAEAHGEVTVLLRRHE